MNVTYNVKENIYIGALYGVFLQNVGAEVILQSVKEGRWDVFSAIYLSEILIQNTR